MERYDLCLPAVLTFENEAGEIPNQKLVTKNVCAGSEQVWSCIAEQMSKWI